MEYKILTRLSFHVKVIWPMLSHIIYKYNQSTLILKNTFSTGKFISTTKVHLHWKTLSVQVSSFSWPMIAHIYNSSTLTLINIANVCLYFLWNSSLIWTMSTSQRDTITLHSVSSSVPSPFIDLYNSSQKWELLFRIHLTVTYRNILFS